ncbi:leucine-rich melanocyte differentiation-associated protein isoform X2 [Drosophila sulfurigaster albostrigata]|uniref:leucine-rich melanocyte differentiation-associated protein isoform X2 n=1 Tax=Drosophila sulfurigaster albostrigata TaxID=89887 RepID=UPI002D21E805|nr:leucine-rich melanocyte differentiation-associated protein isoform X2 [Drosophila sulfurigaster albostrigata]
MDVLDDDDNYSDKLILVQQNLRSMPKEIVERYADWTEHLDLSYNCLKDLSWLGEFEQLRYLVLDSNRMHESQLRTLNKPLPQLEVLMLNKNEFSDLTATIKLIRRLFPNLQYLSLHGNPICPDGLNLQPFSSYLKYDYDNFIAQSLSKLKFLDHGLVQRSYSYESFPRYPITTTTRL